MRLDAMCCEVSLSRWIELGRLTVAVWYGWLCGTASCCEGGGLEPQCFVAAFCCLLHPSFSWYQLSLRQCCLWYASPASVWFHKEDVGGVFSYPNDSLCEEIHACEEMTEEKAQGCDRNALICEPGLCKGTEDSLRAVSYNRVVVGEIVTPKNHDSDPIWLHKRLSS